MIGFIIRLIPQTCQLLIIGQKSSKTKLFLFGRANVKALQLQVAHRKMVTVVQFMEYNTFLHVYQLLVSQKIIAEVSEQVEYLSVTPYIQFALEFTSGMALDEYPYHPDDTQYMVGMTVGYKQIVDVAQGNVSLLQLA